MRTENVVDSLIWFVNVLLAFGIILFAFLFILFPKKESLQHRYQTDLETDEAAPAPTDLRTTLDEYRPCWKRLSEPAAPPPRGPAGPVLSKTYRLTACLPDPLNTSKLQAYLFNKNTLEEKILDVGAPIEAGYKIVEVTRDGLIAERTGTDGKPERQQIDRYVGEEEPGAGGEEAQRDPNNPNHWTVPESERQNVLDHQEEMLNQVPCRPYNPSANGIEGMMMEEVPADSLAAKRGFQKGDVIKSVNGIALNSTEAVNALSSNDGVVKAGTITVVVERQGRSMTMQFDFKGSK